MFRKFYSPLPTGFLRRRNRTTNDVDVEVDNEYLEQIDKARIAVRRLIITRRCPVIMLRLAWQDATTYDWVTNNGGPEGSIRFEEQYPGLKFARDLCEEVKYKYPKITYADLYQLAGVVAVEVASGPKIAFTPGRTDSISSHHGFGKLHKPFAGADHMRLVFGRMGFSSGEIVALLGVHTLGRPNEERPGYGGTWTNDSLVFDNSYFVELTKTRYDGPRRKKTDKFLIQDPELRPYVLEYAQDIDAFFESYAEAHKKFSELGYDFIPEENSTTKNPILLLIASLVAAGALSYLLCDGRKNVK